MTGNGTTAARSRIRVLIADDSAVMRRVLRTILEKQSRMEVVGTASNGKEAIVEFERLRPDLLLLDVEMPEMDGLQALSRVRQIDRKVPVIMCSTLTQRGVQTTIEALSRGATDYVSKQGAQSALSPGAPGLDRELIPKILALFPESTQAACPLEVLPAASRTLPPSAPIPGLAAIVIAVSTGGPAALEVILPRLPARFPVPILIVQHMPMQFTAQLASRLNSLCRMPVREAVDRHQATAGTIYLARGDWHLELTRDFRMRLQQNVPECFCRPSADVLFRSASVATGGHLLGVVLTGMGSDGLEGSRAIRAAGGSIFAQDSTSSIVWGMPGSVANAGLANKIVALQSMADELIRFVSISLPRSA